jgi:hypothetical protein
VCVCPQKAKQRLHCEPQLLPIAPHHPAADAAKSPMLAKAGGMLQVAREFGMMTAMDDASGPYLQKTNKRSGYSMHGAVSRPWPLTSLTAPDPAFLLCRILSSGRMQDPWKKGGR